MKKTAPKILTREIVLALRWKICEDRKSTRLNSSHGYISYAVFCLKKTIRSEAPGTWSVFNHTTHPICFATTDGIISTTDIAGLTLDGGKRYRILGDALSRDNLHSI